MPTLAPGTESPLPARKSMRAQGLFVTLALLAYTLGAGYYIAGQRERIMDNVVALERLAEHEKALALTEAAVSGALVDVSEASNAGLGEPASPNELRLYMETCARLFADLQGHDPGYARLQQAIERSYHVLQATPVRASWLDLRESLGHAADDLGTRQRRLVDQRMALTLGYQHQYDAVTVQTWSLAALGLMAFGALAAWYFARLTGDIRRLEAHALRIVRGSRGVNLAVRRDDELGSLMHAVNRMSRDLDAREKQIQLETENRSHHEKMLAVGALAAGVAHEVNNPLAVISGVAQELVSSAHESNPEQLVAGAQLILAQAQRAGQAARQLAASGRAAIGRIGLAGRQCLVLKQAVQMMGFDRRYRRFEFDLHVDPTLPAVRCSGSAIQQVLIPYPVADLRHAGGARRAARALARHHLARTRRGFGAVAVSAGAGFFARRDPAQLAAVPCRCRAASGSACVRSSRRAAAAHQIEPACRARQRRRLTPMPELNVLVVDDEPAIRQVLLSAHFKGGLPRRYRGFGRGGTGQARGRAL
jgi:two-component system NtrC family sensor kinase